MEKKDISVWAVITGIVALAAVAAAYLNHRGATARTYAGPAFKLTQPDLPLTVVGTSEELYRLYKDCRVKGRLLVHIGKYLHAVEIPLEELLPAGGYPTVTADVLPLYEKRISYRNVLWVAGQANMVREIYYYQPPLMFRKRLAAVDDQDPVLISKGEHTIVLHDWGSRRTIADRMPQLQEPVLLNIDASVFEELQPEQLLTMVRASSLAADIVTLNLARDNPDVPDSCRRSLVRFAKMLVGERAP
jgi:hypothetical protein